MSLVIVERAPGLKRHASARDAASTLCGRDVRGWQIVSPGGVDCLICRKIMARAEALPEQETPIPRPAMNMWIAAVDPLAVAEIDIERLEALTKQVLHKPGFNVLLSPGIALQILALAKDGLRARERNTPSSLKALLKGRT